MSRPEDQIVFEDLHGVNKEEPITVDLDADTKDDGITRTPVDETVDAVVVKDDDIEFESLRSAQTDDDTSTAADTKKLDDDDASKVSADDDYSKKVKARIQRATRATTKEKTRADYWEQQARKLAKDTYESDKSSAERTIEQADSLIDNTQSQLESAIEGGNTKDQVRLTSLLTDQKAAKIQAEVRLENLSPDGNVQPFSDRVAPSTSDGQSLSENWMEERNDWYGARGFERQTRLANRIDKEVFKDGYRPDSPDYFEELDRRLKEKEPKLYEDLEAADDDTGKDDEPDRGRGKQVVAPVSGNESRRQRTSGSKVELGEDDFANMRRFNLDTNDPEVLKEYARNKREAEQGERK